MSHNLTSSLSDGCDTIQALNNICQSFPNKLKIVHLNAESLTYRSHIPAFQLLFDNSDIDVIAVSETFYSCQEDLVKLKNYNIFTANRGTGIGGGIAIYVKNVHACKLLSISVPLDASIKKPDYAILEISLSDIKILFACVYRPPKVGYFDEFADDFISLGIDYKYHIVVGDVNAHFGSAKACDARDGKAVYEFLDVFNLVRIPYNATYHVNDCHSHLDLIASTFHEHLMYYNQYPSGLSNHDLLAAVFSFDVPKFIPRLSTFRSFRNLNLQDFKKDVVDTPWHDMFLLEDVNSKLEFFNHHITALFNKHAPYVTVKVKHRPTPWMSDDLRALIIERDKMYDEIKNCNDRLRISQFRKLKNRTKSEIRNAKVRYSYKILNNCNSSKTLWKGLKKLDVVAQNTTVACKYPSSEELNTHYTAVSCQDEELIRNTIHMYDNMSPLPTDEPFFFRHVYFESLQKAIYGVSPSAKGVDDISAAMVKLCLEELSPAILHIFNYSLQSCCFPNTWKVANVKPLPKKSGACVVKDFRPISLLCMLGKALEKVVHEQLVEYLQRNSLFNPLQSGFRANHSTTTALLKVIGDIRENVDSQHLSMLVLYDFSNAFPSVHHELLLTKLKIYGFSKSVIDWFRSYLTGRAQRVVNDQDISTLIDLLFGVPQGSVLGPLLYSIYVNDIDKIFTNSSYHLYADDLQNYVPFKPLDIVNAVNIVNGEASKLVDYAKSHNLDINAAKTQVIIIGNHKLLKKLPDDVPLVVVNGTVIPYSDVVNDLGILVDKFLNWEPQVNSTCKKAYAAFHGIKKHCDILPVVVRKKLVEALVFPVLDYGNVVTSQMLVVSSIKLQRVQNACARLIFNLRRDCHISSYISDLKWLRIANRFTYASVTLLKKVLCTNKPMYLAAKLQFACNVRNRFVRGSHLLLRIPHHRTDKARGAFWIQAPLLWNQLPDCMLGKSLNSFKLEIKNHLIASQ